MTEKGNKIRKISDVVPSALLSAGIGACISAALAVIISIFLVFVPDPPSLYFPAGVSALLAGAAAAGIIMMKKDGRPAAAFLPGAMIAAAAAIAGAFVKGQGLKPIPLTVALYVLIPVLSFVSASLVGRKKKKRPSIKRRPRRKR